MVYTRSMMKKKKIREAKTNNQTWSELPFDLMLVIMQRRCLKDNIRASAVCKTWREACVSIRVEEPTPWLVTFSSVRNEEHKLYDPSLNKTHIRKSPELLGCYVRYSRDSWLLMYGFYMDTFFFNPFTNERIGLPWALDMWISDAIAFSCAPTSNSCVVFSVYNITDRSITIKTYRPATKEQNEISISSHRFPRKHGRFQHVVFSNEVFYCLTNTGCLGMFSLSTNSWDVLSRRPPKYLIFRRSFLTEYQGDIFLIYINTHDDLEEPRYLKLDLTNQKWTFVKRLGGLTFYLSSKSTLTTYRGSSVYTQRIQQCNSCYDVWINPPTNVSDLFT